KAGADGLEMASGDGVVRRCHLIFATFVGDYPEQMLVTCVPNGKCGSCTAEYDTIGEYHFDDPGFPLRNLEAVLAALDLVDGDPTEYKKACKNVNIKPIYHPFWENLPYTNIFRSLSPDVLHQLYQGMVKHLIAWVIAYCGEAEIDARCRHLPPNHNIHLFMKGICHLSRVTGREHDQISRFLLGIIIDIRLPNNVSSGCLLNAVRGLLDFVHLAQYPMHTDETLALVNNALQTFHENKDIFVDLSIRTSFNLPKLHNALHYVAYIQLFGTTDNTNTEYTERLHIDLAKEAYHSTNFKDEFPQMTVWLEYAKFIKWKLAGCPPPPPRPTLNPGIIYEHKLVMTKHPLVKAVRIEKLTRNYGAAAFGDVLSQFIIRHSFPDITTAQVKARAEFLSLPFNTVPVYHRIKFTTPDPYTASEVVDSIDDSVHVQPANSRSGKRGGGTPGQFDTVLVNDGTGELTGVAGGCLTSDYTQLTRIRLSILASIFPAGVAPPPRHLAYVEWFSPFSNAPEAWHHFYKIKRSMRNGDRDASIVPVSCIRRSIHLLPKFGPIAPKEWTSSNVLDLCPTFFVNSKTDPHVFATLF
ncbi:hypothetical protein C8F01DRAFT_988391, partial [Mycena amicta]